MLAQFTKRLQGSQLRELIMLQSMLMDAGDTIASIVVHLPPTIAKLDLSPAFGKILPALSKTIPRLPLLASLAITSDLANGVALCAVFNALPRAARHLNLYLEVLASNRSFVQHWDALKASLPPTVHTFSLVLSLTDLDRDDETDQIEGPLAQVFPAPTLRSLTLVWGRHNWSWLTVAELTARLPLSLTRLALVNWPLSAEVASVIWPPHLIDLSLLRCDLSTSDMDALAGRWPEHLRRLDLEGNRLRAGIQGLPAGLHELDLNWNRDLGGEDVAWIAALPPSLRVLNLANTRVDGATAEAIMARPVPRRLPRLKVTMGRWSVPRDVLEALQQKVDLVTV
ncbi:hypothetical protein AMAG_05698 [Allomyces macrogynus ATCC 38327]|uniref:Uncharacterized protein n=1 Tax=Allomyces macrogynus (strain ATCC 38327) TaxID=578462 RepID=A0A0L0SCZ1_ALLM3|nr:hypothetical protein AMAG_05698 [Allomyces macrogynus ATCC 38327]|eukprot:KNE60294.1 hypothetical protein AMAG_05698 [Allomyces macrogynus ATCC 38327]